MVKSSKIELVINEWKKYQQRKLGITINNIKNPIDNTLENPKYLR